MKKRMIKIWKTSMPVLLALIILLTTTACSENAVSEPAPTNEPTPSIEQSVPETASPETDTVDEDMDSFDDETLRVRLTFDGGEAIVSLADNVAARGWYDQLPLTLPFENFRSWHKICRIPDNISTEGMAVGNDPDIGDISLHIPWNTLVFYYDEYSGNDSSVHIGHVESGLELIAAMEDGVIVTMEPVNETSEKDPSETTDITMTIGDTIITATLDNSETTQEFLFTLPRTITMNRYADREYYGRIEPISENGEAIPDFSDGDFTYYPAGPSLAVFFARENDSSLGGLIRMGKITSDLSVFDTLDNSAEFIIEVVE